MLVRSYFSKRDDRKLTMPRTEERTSDASGLAFHGDVLTGKLSVQEAFALEAGRLYQTLTPGKHVAPEDYDPVLKSHLGITVLKFHLGIKCAPAARETSVEGALAIDYKRLMRNWLLPKIRVSP